MTAPKSRIKILCVDDEPQVLEGLALHLRRNYEMFTAVSGPLALATLESEPSIAVIVSDMRMPGMDGAAFLARSRQVAPDAVRILLTGEADINSAIHAVNEGQIFRFLTKPCPPATLLAAIEAAVHQHRLVTAERVLLEQTLHGSIKALTDLLAVVSPASFGRAMRIKKLVSAIVDRLGLADRWQVEVAAMLSQIGCVTLPPETAERVYYGHPLSAEEQRLVARVPQITQELLLNIPRLEDVREILRTYTRTYVLDPAELNDRNRAIAVRGAEILKVAVDFDALDSAGGPSADLALETLRGRVGHYDREVLEALAAHRGAKPHSDVRELPTNQLRPGMILAEDVKLRSGALLCARGYEISERFLDRTRNFSSDILYKPLWRVIVPSSVRDNAA